MMSKIRPNFLAAIIIIFIVVISVVMTVIYFSETNKEALAGGAWTPVIPGTSTPSLTPSNTAAPDESERLNDFTPTPTNTQVVRVNCVYPADYWEEHPELWLEMVVGNTMYDSDEIRQIFEDPSQEAYAILLKQIYLTNLNILSGADPSSIQGVLGEADIWLQSYSPDEQLPEGSKPFVLQLAQTLSDFNAGIRGPGFCSPYEDLVVTPLVFLETMITLTPTPTSTASPTATREVVPGQPRSGATATPTDKPKQKPKDDDPPKATKVPDTPVPPPPPTNTKAPPPPPTDPPEPTDPPPKPTPTPAT
jgi:hypothetical protein